ncbi:MAG: MXAN_6640 family putative metalloprotease [Gaiellaceae bacterium]
MRRAFGVTFVIALTLTAVAGAQTAATAKTAPRHERAALPAAEVALQRALAIFRPALAQPRFRGVARTDPRSATMVLRDLVGRLNELSPADRKVARSILARPTDTGSGNYSVARTYFRHTCPANFCVHWVVSGRDAPSLVDRAPKNRIPDWIDKVKSVMATVWSKEVTTYGYKKPRADGPYGGHRGGNPNSKLDVFIADVGRRGLYGYCTTDDPHFNTQNRLSAYCVLDDDFVRTQFPTGAYGVNALKVTAAHEFNHAIQFAYDYFEDRALMEGTATNMEATVYPTIHDNYQYFQSSPLSRSNPWYPIDIFRGSAGSQQYGSWIFYRFLAEYFTGVTTTGTFPITTAPNTLFARQIWENAASPGGTNGGAYSTEAIEQMIADQGSGDTFPDLLRQFGVANAAPTTFYKDGAAFGTAAAQNYSVTTLTAGLAGTVWTYQFEMFHMSTDYAAGSPGVDANTVQVAADFPPGIPGLGATVLVFNPGGTLTSQTAITLVNGDGTTAPMTFTEATVGKIVVVVTNGSTSFSNCYTDSTLPTFSCSGVADDDSPAGVQDYAVKFTVLP